MQQLVLKNNPDLAESAYTAIAQKFIFTENSYLNKLDISANRLTETKLSGFLQAGEEFAASYKRNNVFVRLIIKQNYGLETAAFKKLLNVLILNPKNFALTKLSLKFSLTNEKVAVLIEELSSNNLLLPSLVDLSFDKNNQLSTESLVDLLELLFIRNTHFPNLERLTLTFCNISDTHMKELMSRNLKSPPSPKPIMRLKTLSLKGNTCLTSTGWLMISYLLFRTEYFPYIKSLNFSYCKLEEASIS